MGLLRWCECWIYPSTCLLYFIIYTISIRACMKFSMSVREYGAPETKILISSPLFSKLSLKKMRLIVTFNELFFTQVRTLKNRFLLLSHFNFNNVLSNKNHDIIWKVRDKCRLKKGEKMNIHSLLIIGLFKFTFSILFKLYISPNACTMAAIWQLIFVNVSSVYSSGGNTYNDSLQMITFRAKTCMEA